MKEKRIPYLERFIFRGEDNALREGANEIGKDLSAILNKYQREDMPLVLACIKMAIPQIERLCGEPGVAAAADICKVMGCVRFSWREAGNEQD